MANNLTLTSPTYDTTGQKYGSAALSGGYGVTATNPLAGLSSVTIEFWVKTTSGTTSVITGSNTGGQWYIATNGATISLSGNGSAGTSGVTANDGAYHFVSVVWTASGSTIYVDGVSRGTGTNVFTASSYTGNMGVRAFDTGSYPLSSGNVDEVAVWNYARSGAVPAGALTGSESGLVALYHLDGNGTDSASATASPTNSVSSVSPLVAGSSSTVSGAYSNGAPAGLTYALDGAAAVTASSPTITTSSGTGATAAGTYSFAITAPAAGSHAIVVNGTGTYASASGSYSFTTTAAAATPNILPNDSNIIYSPGNWDVTSARAKTIYGAYARMEIGGSVTAIAALFDVSNQPSPPSQVEYSIDGGPYVASAVAASISIPVPTTNTWGTHVIEIRQKSSTVSVTNARWPSPQQTAILFRGLATTPSSAATVATVSRPLRGLVFGDSITEGYDALSNTNVPDVGSARLSFAGQLEAALGAEIGNIGLSAIGWNVAGAGGVPTFPNSWNLLWASGPSRSLTGYDFIVVNMGQNDGTNNVTTTETSTLNAMLAAAPSTPFFVMRPFLGNQAAALQTAIAASTNPGQITYVDTTGWMTSADGTDGLHPAGYVAMTSLAPRLAAVIRAKLRGVRNPWSRS